MSITVLRHIEIDRNQAPRRIAADFEQQVAAIVTVDLYNVSRVGRIVLDGIAAEGRRVRIVPRTPQDHDAETLALHEPDATLEGEPLRTESGQPVPGPHGTGIGSPSTIRFTSQDFTWTTGFAGTRTAGVQFDQREVLLHELSHALRHVTGTQTMRPMPDGLDNADEFFAALVTNIYSSERRRPLLRDHGTRILHHPEMWLRSPAHVNAINNDFRRNMREFTTALAAVPTPFNPFRDLP
jgi:hypothetical protein